MRRLQASQLSGKYRVRLMTQADVPEIYALTRQNVQYYAYCGRNNIPEDIAEDLVVCPPGKTPEDKYYVGFYEGSMLVAVMDLIDGYPDDATAYIGFFMMNAACQGKGLGTAIISEAASYLRKMGFAAVMLGYEKSNPQSSHFWQKNGFLPVREKDCDAGVIVVARRELNRQA